MAAEADKQFAATCDSGSKVRASVAGMLADGAPSMVRVARACGLAPRTLQRRLADEATSFSALLDEVRRERALASLADGTGSLGELAVSLGYKRQASLTRAVRRWTGRSPNGVREDIQAKLDALA